MAITTDVTIGSASPDSTSAHNPGGRFADVPDDLRAYPQWVVWRWEKSTHGKLTKVPYNPHTGRRGATDDPSTWGSFAYVLSVSDDYDGIGFVFSAGDPFAGIDLDDCRQPETGEIVRWARRIVEHLDSYAEVSPSGTGLKVFVRGRLLPGKGNRKALEHLPKLSEQTPVIEVYDSKRFFTVTAQHLAGTPARVEEREDELRKLHRGFPARVERDGGHAVREAQIPTLTDDELFATAAFSDRFLPLVRGDWSEMGYSSQSEADLALCSILARAGGTPQQVDRAFRQSALMREKWDGTHAADGRTYGQMTVDKALAGGSGDGWRPAAGDQTEVSRPGIPTSLSDVFSPQQRRNLAHRQPNGYSAAALMNMDLPEPRWAVAGFIPEGATLFAGGEKIGKSWLTLGTAVAVAMGGTALGNIPVEAGDVLLLALEDTKRRLQGRLEKVLVGAPAPERLTIFNEWRRLHEGGLEDLEKWVGEHPAARLVIIDTLAKVRPPQRSGANAYEEDYRVMGWVKELADRHEIAIVVVHHTRKMKADDPFEMVSGSRGLTAAADATMVIMRARGQRDASLHITGRDVEERANDTAMALRWDEHTGLWSHVGQAFEQQRSQERTEILRLLSQSERPLSPKETASLLGKNPNTVKTIMWKMAKQGELVSDRGKYSVAEGSLTSEKPVNSVNRMSEVRRSVDSVDGVYGAEPDWADDWFAVDV